MWIAVGIVVVLLIAVFAIGNRLSKVLVFPHRTSMEEGRGWNIKCGFQRDFDDYEKQSYTVTAPDGYLLNAEFIPAKEPSNRYMILSHGYSSNRLGSVKYLHMYRDFGCNCVIYDDRAHGENAETYCTLGLKESDDLLAVLKDTYRRFGSDIRVGLHGESMGSALTLLALGKKPNVKFAVIDCGFANLQDVIKGKLKKDFHLPAFFCYPGDLVCKLRFGYWSPEVRPIDVLKENEIPLCFMHGTADTFIPCSHSQQMHEANKGYSELHLFPGAEHARAIGSDEARYRSIVKKFIEKYF